MRDLLRQSNLDLLREMDRLRALLEPLSVPIELVTYRDEVSKACNQLRQLALQSLRDLELGREDTLDDILSQTQLLTAGFRLYNQRLASPLLRYRPSDRLCLRIITWLHGYHAETSGIPAGLNDGEFGIWPEPRIPIIYFMPSTRQHGLLYLPLFFHEFAHLLYACHRQEMDELVCELQEEIAELLRPASQRNDIYAHQAAMRRDGIVETWYEWTQELFCDAAGLAIGGPCFANAFSMYLRMGGRGKFHQPLEQLALSAHPVAWLRIRLLADRARQMSLAEADDLESHWEQIATTMQVTEDYCGFYDDRFLLAIRRTMDDMLTEAAPYRFSAEDVSELDWSPEHSPVRLLNKAWSVFLNSPDDYTAWEQQAVSAFLEQRCAAVDLSPP